MQITAELLRTAHADAWQVQGQLRRPDGGDAAALPGVRLMASGLPHPQWNNGDVHDPAAVDIAAVTRWYGERAVPWGMRVPAGAHWPHGRLLFGKRLMGLGPAQFVPAPFPAGVDVRAAGAEDLEAVLAVDTVCFDESPDLERRWIGPHLRSDRVDVVLASVDGRPVGTGYCLRSDGVAGPAAYLAGVCVLPEHRGRGVAKALCSSLLGRAFTSGAHLAHLHPDDDRAARLYVDLGFVEVDGLDVYVHAD